MSEAKAARASSIRAMFDRLAPRYDLMNRVMTLGQDQRWRRFVVTRARIAPKARVLDLASGTGDIAFEIKRRFPEANVVAADFSLGMLDRGKQRKHGGTLNWVACDAQRLPFRDACFDAVTFGYLLRNVTDMNRTLQEVWRVLKPGGRIVCLDTTPPPDSWYAAPVRFYLKHGLPLLGRLLAGNAGSYAYLTESTLAFQSAEELRRLFQVNEFHDIDYRLFMLKTVAVHWGRKPDNLSPG